MSEGWISLHRGWRDNPIFRGEFSRADAWVWLIENACWRPARFDIKGKIVTLDRGQVCASRDRLASVWGWSPSAVERYLTRLQTEHMIGRETGQGKSVITICNYTKYQDRAEEAGQETGQEPGQTSDRHRTAKEQGNKETIVRGEEAKASPPARERKSDPFPKPEGVDDQVWLDFLANRKRKSLPNTATAHKRMLSDLARFADDEWPPGRLLEHAAAKGWAGIYDPRETQNGQSRQNSGRSGQLGSGQRSSLDQAIDAGLASLG